MNARRERIVRILQWLGLGLFFVPIFTEGSLVRGAVCWAGALVAVGLMRRLAEPREG